MTKRKTALIDDAIPSEAWWLCPAHLAALRKAVPEGTYISTSEDIPIASIDLAASEARNLRFGGEMVYGDRVQSYGQKMRDGVFFPRVILEEPTPPETKYRTIDGLTRILGADAADFGTVKAIVVSALDEDESALVRDSLNDTNGQPEPAQARVKMAAAMLLKNPGKFTAKYLSKRMGVCESAINDEYKAATFCERQKERRGSELPDLPKKLIVAIDRVGSSKVKNALIDHIVDNRKSVDNAAAMALVESLKNTASDDLKLAAVESASRATAAPRSRRPPDAGLGADGYSLLIGYLQNAASKARSLRPLTAAAGPLFADVMAAWNAARIQMESMLGPTPEG